MFALDNRHKDKNVTSTALYHLLKQPIFLFCCLVVFVDFRHLSPLFDEFRFL